MLVKSWIRPVLILSAIIFVLCSTAFAQNTDQDTTLDSKLNLCVKGEALSDICKLLTQQTGIQLSVSKSIADQKATILVTDKPLSEIMSGLTTIFGYRWGVKDINGDKRYELFQDEASRKTKEQKQQENRQKAYERLHEELDLLAQYADKSKEELEVLMAKLDADMDALFSEIMGQEFTDKHNELLDKLNYQRSVISTLIYDDRTGPAAKLYKSFNQPTLEALWSGMEVCFDSHTNEPEWLIPFDITQAILDEHNKQEDEWEVPNDSEDEEYQTIKLEADGISIKFKLEEDTESVSLGLTIGYRQAPGQDPFEFEGRTSFTSGLSTSLCGVSFDDDDSFAEQVKLPQEDMEPLKEKKVTITAQDIAEEANIAGQTATSRSLYATKSDILAIIHKKTGIQVISDYYSEWSYQQVASEVPVLVVIQRSLQHHRYSGTDFGWDGKYLYSRARFPEVADAAEIPNRLLDPWRKIVAKQGYLNLDQLGEVAQLNEAQLESINEYGRFLGLFRTPSWGFHDSALKLYGTLSQRQKTEAFSGGTPVFAFNQAQLAAIKGWIDEESQFPDPDEMKVGIYRDGIRIDKPQPPTAGQLRQPVSFNIREAGIDDTESYDWFSPDMPSIEERMDEQADYQQKSIPIRNMLYIAELHFNDGDEINSWIRVPMKVLPPGTELQHYSSVPENYEIDINDYLSPEEQQQMDELQEQGYDFYEEPVMHSW